MYVTMMKTFFMCNSARFRGDRNQIEIIYMNCAMPIRGENNGTGIHLSLGEQSKVVDAKRGTRTQRMFSSMLLLRSQFR